MKKIVLAVALFAISATFAIVTGSVASAQTVSPTVTTTTTMMLSPTTSVPGGAPATGRQ